MCIGYNMEMIENAGLEDPYDLWKRGEWTWDVFLDYAQKLTTGEGTDKVYGFTSEEASGDRQLGMEQRSLLL